MGPSCTPGGTTGGPCPFARGCCMQVALLMAKHPLMLNRCLTNFAPQVLKILANTVRGTAKGNVRGFLLVEWHLVDFNLVLFLL